MTPELIGLPDEALTFRYVTSSGPGGQNVNKVATATELRLDLERAGLPVEVRQRLERLAGRRLNQRGEIVIFAQRYRTQARNREDALARLGELVQRAREAPKARVATKPSGAAKKRRRDVKSKRGQTKRMRKPPALD